MCTLHFEVDGPRCPVCEDIPAWARVEVRTHGDMANCLTVTAVRSDGLPPPPPAAIGMKRRLPWSTTFGASAARRLQALDSTRCSQGPLTEHQRCIEFAPIFCGFSLY